MTIDQPFDMRSIRTQLVVWLVGCILMLAAAAGLGLYQYMEEVLERGLDAELAAKAEAIANTVQIDNGQPRLQTADINAPMANHREGPFYFQIWRDDGSTLARNVSSEMGDTPLPHMTKPHRHFEDARLSDRTSARITELSFFAKADEDDGDLARKILSPSTAHLVLVVAHDRRSIDGPLEILLSGLAIAAIVISTGIVFIVTWVVRRGLLPLAKVSAMADRIGPDSLDVRFPGRDQLPPELVPIGLKLNELLDRLTVAFARERRFSAAVAHELRTPLAELRSACDVALRWPDDPKGLSTALSEARDVAIEMSTMVQSLLSLARRQAGIEPLLPAEPISLSTAIAQAWPESSTVIIDHQLTIENNVDPSAVVESNPILLTAVLQNLLKNAIEYTSNGGKILIRTVRNSAGQWLLHIANSCTDLTPVDISQLFEPFWRKDASRTGSHHAGLGLTLVNAYCEAIGVSVTAALISPDQLEVTLQFQSPKQPALREERLTDVLTLVDSTGAGEQSAADVGDELV